METASQEHYMEVEQCILLNEKDEVIGAASKKECHLNTSIEKGMLHRAFSVFLFNSKGELLLQRRAGEKITFPMYWTNTCCSHPLYLPDEMEAENQIGVKRAAQRKLQHELGINPAEVPLEDFKYLTRLHYQAPSDETWGEHEIDYLLFIQKDVTCNINPAEVDSVQYVSHQQLLDLLKVSDAKGDSPITPWFRLVCDNFLGKWWEALLAGNLDQHVDLVNIHKLG